MEMDVKAYHCPARPFVNLNLVHIQRVHREDIAVRFPFWRRRAAVARFAKVRAGLNRTVGQGNQIGTGTLRQHAGVGGQVCHDPVPPARAGWRIWIVAGHDKTFGSRWYIVPRQMGRDIISLITHPVKHVTFRQLFAVAQIFTDDFHPISLVTHSFRKCNAWG